MKSDLYIRTDGSTDIGLGHLVRCMSLSFILKDQFDITFFCLEIPKQIEDELALQKIKLRKIDYEREFFDQLTDRDIVVLDGYSFDSNYQKAVREKAHSFVCIDDLHDREFYADAIINHAPGITREHYSAQFYTRFALGVDYVLLRPPFLEAALKSQNKREKKPTTILICFGGADRKNLTLRSLNVVSDFNQFKKIIIITGSAYRFKDELLHEIDEDPTVEYHHALSGEEMAMAFFESDVAVVPSSGILFEALATGNAAISGMYTDNQKDVYSGFKSIDAIIDAGGFSEREIHEAIKKIHTFEAPKKLIDGKSPERIRTLFQTIKETNKKK